MAETNGMNYTVKDTDKNKNTTKLQNINKKTVNTKQRKKVLQNGTVIQNGTVVNSKLPSFKGAKMENDSCRTDPIKVRYLNPFIPQFLKLTLPSL